MKKRITAMILTLAVLLALCVPVLAASDISGYYEAASCSQNGQNYACDGEYLLLNADGSGEVVFDGEIYAIAWEMNDSGGFCFVDGDGYELTGGTYSDGKISGNYAGYDYVYEFSGTAGTTQGETVEEYVDGVSYYPTSCMQDGEEYSSDGEYIIFGAAGNGIVVYDGCAYGMEWSSDGTDLTLTDSMGNKLTGTVSDDILTATFHGYEYVYEPGDPAPILSLSPSTWGTGLPFVTDQADILSQEQETTLSSQAERISKQYACNVYIVTLDDMDSFSLSHSVETCAEEIRTGYELGFGTDKDCVILLLSMAERDYDLCAYGDFGNASFTDYGKYKMEKEFLDDFGDDNWFAGFSDYLTMSEELLEMSAKGSPLDTNTAPVSPVLALFLSLLVGFIIAFSISSVLKAKMKAVKEQTQAAEYVGEGGADITYCYDRYTHTTESRVYDPPTKSNDGSGTSTSSSGHSHSSGKF